MKRKPKAPGRPRGDVYVAPLPGQLELPVEYVHAPLAPLHIRWLCHRDLDDVAEIELFAFDDPWCAEEFADFLKSRNRIGMVAEHDERVVGYMLYELLPHGIGLVNLAAAPWLARRKIGSQLLARLAGKLAQQRRTEIFCRVAEANLPAQLFFRACGFRAIGVDRGWFAGRHGEEDAIQFRYQLPAAAALPTPPARRCR
jgi:ribosomal-protein-alanine N-acetyltransferase